MYGEVRFRRGLAGPALILSAVIGDEFPAVLAAAQDGSEAAFARLWRDGNTVLLRYLRAAMRDCAEDVAAETWLQVVRGLATFRGDEQAWRSWLFTIARRRMLDEHRRRARHPEAPYADLPPGAEPAVADAAAWALGNLAAAELVQAVRELPPQQAEIILLRILADLDNETVARIVGRSPGAVRIAAHRGLRRLAQNLAAQGVTRLPATAFQRAACRSH